MATPIDDWVDASLDNQATYDELRNAGYATLATGIAQATCEQYVGEVVCGRPLAISAYGTWFGGEPMYYSDEEHE